MTRKRSESGVLGILRDRLRRRPSELLLQDSFLQTSDNGFGAQNQISVHFPKTPILEERDAAAEDHVALTPPLRTPRTPEFSLSPLDKLLVMIDKSKKAKRRQGVVFDDGAEAGQLADAEDDFDVDAVHEGYEERSWFRSVDAVKLHPYGSEAVYMQDYNEPSLTNDKSLFDLLKRLNANNSPSFKDYGENPPLNVLDLGCGEGHWVVDAAKAWEAYGTKVTGLDLVNVTGKFAQISSNVTWKRANFVQYALPFEDGVFDFVRICNLTLCVPLERWGHVIREVGRVLVPGGRIEVIDDQIYFPYDANIKNAIDPPTSRSSISSGSSNSSSHASVPSLTRTDSSGSSDSACSESVPITPTVEDVTISGSIDPDRCGSKPHAIEDLSGFVDCHYLEDLFETMLIKKYRVYSRPHNVFLDLFKRTLGAECEAKKIKSIHLSLPTAEMEEAAMVVVKKPGSAKLQKGRGRKLSFTLDRLLPTVGEKERVVLADEAEEKTSQISSRASSDESLFTSESYSSVSSFPSSRASDSSSSFEPETPAKQKPYQPKGLILYPDTFIPMSPSEIQMHACKNIQILLGCKVALGEYMSTTFLGDNGKQLISDEQWNDTIWKYECLRLRRFNLPDTMNFDDDDDDDLFATPSKKFKSPFSKRERSSSETGSVYDFAAGTSIRAIRVFEAYKPK